MNTINLNTCKPGQKLRLRNGDVVEYKRKGWCHVTNETRFNFAYCDDGKVYSFKDHDFDIIEIIMETKQQRIEAVEAQLKQAQDEMESASGAVDSVLTELRAIREEPDTPPLQLKDKHVYRREDGSVVFVFGPEEDGEWAAVSYSGEVTLNYYNADGSEAYHDKGCLVECIGKIGVVSKDAGLEYGSNAKGTYATPITYDPNTLTGEKIS